MQETIVRSIQVLAGQASATVKPPVASTIALLAPSVPVMGKETLYNDRQSREGMALGRYGGDFAKLKPKGFAWQDRKKEGKNPFETTAASCAAKTILLPTSSETAISCLVRRILSEQYLSFSSSPRPSQTRTSNALSAPYRTFVTTLGCHSEKIIPSPMSHPTLAAHPTHTSLA